MKRDYAEALARRAMEELGRWANLDERFSTLKDAPTGTVIRFRRMYEEDGKDYSFAALKVVNGLWYLTKATNSRVMSPLPYDSLIQFLETATSIQVATSWAEVDAAASQDAESLSVTE